MSAIKTESDGRVLETWNEAAATMDWTPFPVGYGILLNERYQFPMDMALVRMKLDNSRQLFVDNHLRRASAIGGGAPGRIGSRANSHG